MPTPLSLRIPLHGPCATAALARALAPHLGAGDTLALSGGIGAGKSHFARALIKARLAAAGRDEDVPSPTYTLVQTYRAGALEIWHSDLYRLGDAGEAAELGLDEAFATALCLVEWPDRLEGGLPADTLHLGFAHCAGDDDRVLTIAARGGDWAARLAPVLSRWTEDA